MKVLMMTLDENVPFYTLNESRIGDNPGLGFRPMPRNISQGSLIWYKPQNATSVEQYTAQIDKFLKRKPHLHVLPIQRFQLNAIVLLTAYTINYTNAVPCSFNTKAPKDKVCKPEFSLFKDCVKSNNYGYSIGKPCIFLKLNRVSATHEMTSVNDLIETFPYLSFR